MLIKVKNYEHFNRAMGKHISSKKQYEQEMAKGGFIPFVEAKKIPHKDYKELGSEAQGLLRYAKQIKDRKGKLKLGGRAIEAMKKFGMNFGRKPEL